MMDMNGLSGGHTGFDAEDERKLEEEADMQFLPEEIDRYTIKTAA